MCMNFFGDIIDPNTHPIEHLVFVCCYFFILFSLFKVVRRLSETRGLSQYSSIELCLAVVKEARDSEREAPSVIERFYEITSRESPSLPSDVSQGGEESSESAV